MYMVSVQCGQAGMGTRVMAGGCPSGLRTVILGSCALDVSKNKGTAIRDSAIKNPFSFLFTDSSPSRVANAPGSSFYSSKIEPFHKTTVEKPDDGLHGFVPLQEPIT
jgi:hypothetical protein